MLPKSPGSPEPNRVPCYEHKAAEFNKYAASQDAKQGPQESAVSFSVSAKRLSGRAALRRRGKALLREPCAGTQQQPTDSKDGQCVTRTENQHLQCKPPASAREHAR